MISLFAYLNYEVKNINVTLPITPVCSEEERAACLQMIFENIKIINMSILIGLSLIQKRHKSLQKL